jgi:hypothetical protein
MGMTGGWLPDAVRSAATTGEQPWMHANDTRRNPAEARTRLRVLSISGAFCVSNGRKRSVAPSG